LTFHSREAEKAPPLPGVVGNCATVAKEGNHLVEEPVFLRLVKSTSDSAAEVKPSPSAGIVPDVAGSSELPSVEVVMAKPHQSSRQVIDVLVGKLKRRHQQNRTHLSRRTDQLVKELGLCAEARGLSVDVLVGIVVAAKHFAGTLSPRKPALRAHKKGFAYLPGINPAKRKLFDGEAKELPKPVDNLDTTEVAPCQSERSNEVTFAEPLIGPMTEEKQWQMDIWKSYGSGETKPPSPMGYQWSPSVALLENSPPPLPSPVAGWSPSSDDEPWGPDSPMEHLEFDSQEVVPNWPHFVDSEGQLLRQGSEEWTQRVNIWSQYRTPGFVRATRKRRHHCRARKAERVQYEVATALRSMMTFDWDENRWRPTSLEDVKLPSPTCDHDNLLRVRRVILRQRNLPKGSRIQPSRKAKRRCHAPAITDDHPVNFVNINITKLLQIIIFMFCSVYIPEM
jgi:hypothetical protein